MRGMTTYLRRQRDRLRTVLLCSVMAGCASSPSLRYFALVATGEQHPVAAASTLRIEVGPVSVPQSIDRSELVLFREGSRVTLLEQDHWAEPLRVGIGRVLAQDLARALGASLVWAYPQRGVPDPNVSVSVDIQRLETDGSVVRLEALWSVRSTAVGASPGPRIGHSSLEEPVSGAGTAALVDAQSRALAGMAQQIAAALAASP
jgi:uncharacterized lipoprotein YmbA